MAKSSGSGARDSSYVFFWLLNAVLIVLSNVAFQQYALYNLEAERISQRIDGLGVEYENSLLMESVIEIKNTLVISHTVMSSERNMLEAMEHLLSRQYNLSGGDAADAAYLIERNRELGVLMDEVSNLSAYVAGGAPDFGEYKESILAETESLDALKSSALESGRMVWKIGFLLIVNSFVMIIYALYLSQTVSLDLRGMWYVRNVKFLSVLQVVFSVYTIFGGFIGVGGSDYSVYVVGLLLVLSVLFTSSQILGRFSFSGWGRRPA